MRKTRGEHVVTACVQIGGYAFELRRRCAHSVQQQESALPANRMHVHDGAPGRGDARVIASYKALETRKRGGQGKVLKSHRVYLLSGRSRELIAEEDRFVARTYAPLDLVVERGEGAWLWDVDGKRYLDCVSAY